MNCLREKLILTCENVLEPKYTDSENILHCIDAEK